MKLSPCGRFLVLDGLHIDREVLGALARWSDRRGLRIQDAVQLAILFFTEHATEVDDVRPSNIGPSSANLPLLDRSE